MTFADTSYFLALLNPDDTGTPLPARPALD